MNDGLNFSIVAPRPKLPKPHMEMFAGRWMYFDELCCGWGRSWREAYNDWFHQTYHDVINFLLREQSK